MTIREEVTLDELDKGSLFIWKGSYCLKTEYKTDNGAIEAYIVGSGEMFWGGTTNATEQAKLLVKPIEL